MNYFYASEMSANGKAKSKARTTKKEKMAFLDWFFNDDNYDRLRDESGGIVSMLYQQHCGIIVSPVFVNRNRNIYHKADGSIVKKPVKIALVYPNMS